jgi:hypothetical protein
MSRSRKGGTRRSGTTSSRMREISRRIGTDTPF